MPRLIGLHGLAGSGKDTAAEILVEQQDWTRGAFADRMRTAILALDPIVDFGRDEHEMSRSFRLSEIVASLGWDKAKRNYPEIRRLLQRFGTEAGRDIHGENCWVQIVLDPWFDGNYDLVVTDARFPNECQAIRDLGGFVIEIVRPGLEKLEGNHASEAGVPRHLIDVTIVNDGTVSQLHQKILLTVRNLSPA